MFVICIFWGEIKANMCWQEPALTGGCGCYLQALADTPFSGQRLIPETGAFIELQGIFQKLHQTRAPKFILGGSVRQRRSYVRSCSHFLSFNP